MADLTDFTDSTDLNQRNPLIRVISDSDKGIDYTSNPSESFEFSEGLFLSKS